MPATLNQEKINEIKTVIRSLLISSIKTDVTLGKLNGMYREEEGTNIPFREFNCSSLIDFLKSIPDTVRFQTNRQGEICLKHVDTEKTVHVSSLVSRQRKPVRKAKSAYSYKPRHNYHHYIKPVQQYYNPSSQNVLIEVLRELKNSPSRRGGIRKSELLHYVRERLGRYALYTIQSLNVHLYQLQHMLHVQEDYIFFKDDPPKRVENCQPLKPLIPVNNLFASHNNNQTTEVKNNLPQKTIPDCKYSQNTCNQTKQIICTEKIQNSNGMVMQNNCTEILENGNAKIEQNFHKVEQNSNKIEQKSNNAEPSSNIEENKTSKSVEQNSNIQDQQDSQYIETNSECDLIKDRTKIRLQKLIENHPEGIWCSELPSIYKKEYKIDLEYNDLGFNNITEFVAALPTIFRIVEPPNTNRMMVLDARKINGSSNQTKTMASLYNFNDYIANDPEPIPTRLSSGVSRSLIPEGVMTLNEIVDQISVSSLLYEEYIEVLISEIFTPSFFWIILRQNKKKRKTMMSELDEFYRNRDLDEYKIPQVILEPGLNVACVYAKVWHRGIIKKIKPDGFVIIFFYDYGTVKTYNPNDLYFLHKKFSVLPAQAIACGLHNVKPIGSNEWPQKSVSRFIRKVWDLPLIAMISSVNEENNSMMITLTDTSDDTSDLHIGDWMVENEFAEWGKMVSSVPIHKLCTYDELELQKSKDEENIQVQVNHTTTNDLNIQTNCEPEYSRESCHSPNLSSNYLDFSNPYVSPNVANVITEFTGLIKQTNTIAQAILLNQDNTSDVNNTCYPDSKNITNNRDENSYDVTLPLSETLNKKFTADLNSNLSTIKVNISEMNNNYYGSEFLKCEYAKPKSTDNFGNKSSQSYPNSTSSDCKLGQMKKINSENESVQSEQCPKRRASVNSINSYRSNVEFEPILENVKNQHKQDIDYDSASSSDPFGENHGTPFYEIKTDSNLPKSNNIKIKFPFEFANLHINKSESSNNPANGMTSENVNKTLSNNDEIDEGYYTTTRPSTSQTCSKSSSSISNATSTIPDYTTLNLSSRCDNKLVHIFHLDNEGWICVNEFIDAFTNLKDPRVLLKLLKFINYEVNFKYLTREKEPQLFTQLDKSLFKIPREGSKIITTSSELTLLPLKSMLQVLVNLDFLTRKMLDKAVPLMKQCKENVEDVLYEEFNNKILYDALNLIVQYRKFKVLRKSLQQ